MESYVRSLADPFDTSIIQPKFLDGRIDRTSGLRLRVTGTVTCETTGYTYFSIMPGISNVVSWWLPSQGGLSGTAVPTGNVPTPYTGFAETTTDVNAINRYRLIGAGVRFTLLNSGDMADGIFEAIRVGNQQMFAYAGTNQVIHANSTTPALFNDAANNPSYVQGRLRDINQYMFRLNYRNAELDFKNAPTLPGANGNLPVNTNFDMILIRIRGRQVTGEPSLIMYDAVAMNEVEYVEGTALNRLMLYNTVLNNMDEMANRLNIKQAAIRVN